MQCADINSKTSVSSYIIQIHNPEVKNLKNKIYQRHPNPEYLSFIISDEDFTSIFRIKKKTI
jgi:hypothetical protein